MALTPHRRHDAPRKTLILETVQRAQAHSGQSVEQILHHLALPSATYYRWKERAEEGRLTDRVVPPRRPPLPPTPSEVRAVEAFALAHPPVGYKRLTWEMVDEDIAYLRPTQVYNVLHQKGLLARRLTPPAEELRRPPAPDHADQVWHVDLMYLSIAGRWYYLVDILDGYSRFLVHWSLNRTMSSDTVTFTVQEALEQLPSRRAGEPQVVHDHGSQFLSREWRLLIEGMELTDVRTRVAHPQSNGRLERLHRTHREEGLAGEELTNYMQALECLTRWSHYYNYERSHSALRYLRPIDYYRGDPAARLAKREQKLTCAVQERRKYWQTHVIKER